MIFKLPRKRWVVLALLGTALSVAVPAAWATFNDVPGSNPFYNDINAIQGAGITQGCGGGNFCPEDNITRQAEAAFTHRAAGRVAFAYLPVRTPPNSIAVPTGWTTTLSAGGISGGTGFVKADAEVSICNNDATKISFDAELRLDGTAISGDITYLDLAAGDCGNIALTGAGPVTTGADHTLSVAMSGNAATLSQTNGNLTAMYLPFGPTGTSAYAPLARAQKLGGLRK